MLKLYMFPRNNGDGSSSIVLSLDKDLVEKVKELEGYPYDPYEEFQGDDGQYINLPEGTDLSTLGEELHTIEDYEKECE